MSDYISRQAAYDAIRDALNRSPFAQVWHDATYEDGFNDGYRKGWDDGQEELRKEMWERERERLDQ